MEVGVLYGEGGVMFRLCGRLCDAPDILYKIVLMKNYNDNVSFLNLTSNKALIVDRGAMYLRRVKGEVPCQRCSPGLSQGSS